MAKRTLGLGKASKKLKKAKPNAPESESSHTKDSSTQLPFPKSNELAVELEDEADPDDELAQLKGLWITYSNSDKENELVLNGIIHECDRLLRHQTDANRLPSEFHSIYALALSELALFNTEDDDYEEAKSNDKKKNHTLKQYFEAALKRVELGQEQYPESIELNFAKARIIINRIPLEYISKFDIATEKTEDVPEISKILDQALKSYEAGEESVNSLKNYGLLDSNIFEILNALDDLLDIVRNFGNTSIAEGLDSDDEDDEIDEEVVLSKSHPLYKVRKSGKYFKWLISHGKQFSDNVLEQYRPLLEKKAEDLTQEQQKNVLFLKKVSLKIGQLLLQAAEKPSSIFTTLTYDSEFEDESKIEGTTAKEAQKEAIDYTKKAVELFAIAEDEEDPQSWVNHAEAVIQLGNLYDYESKEQNKAYALAEKKLKIANNATNGKFQNVLDELLNG